MPFFENNKDSPKKSKVKAIQFLLQKIQFFVTNASINKRVTSWTPALIFSCYANCLAVSSERALHLFTSLRGLFIRTKILGQNLF